MKYRILIAVITALALIAALAPAALAAASWS